MPLLSRFILSTAPAPRISRSSAAWISVHRSLQDREQAQDTAFALQRTIPQFGKRRGLAADFALQPCDSRRHARLNGASHRVHGFPLPRSCSGAVSLRRASRWSRSSLSWRCRSSRTCFGRVSPTRNPRESNWRRRSLHLRLLPIHSRDNVGEHRRSAIRETGSRSRRMPHFFFQPVRAAHARKGSIDLIRLLSRSFAPTTASASPSRILAPSTRPLPTEAARI